MEVKRMKAKLAMVTHLPAGNDVIISYDPEDRNYVIKIRGKALLSVLFLDFHEFSFWEFGMHDFNVKVLEKLPVLYLLVMTVFP